VKQAAIDAGNGPPEALTTAERAELRIPVIVITQSAPS
jgi:hypothetical protein